MLAAGSVAPPPATDGGCDQTPRGGAGAGAGDGWPPARFVGQAWPVRLGQHNRQTSLGFPAANPLARTGKTTAGPCPQLGQTGWEPTAAGGGWPGFGSSDDLGSCGIVHRLALGPWVQRGRERRGWVECPSRAREIVTPGCTAPTGISTAPRVWPGGRGKTSADGRQLRRTVGARWPDFASQPPEAAFGSEHE